MFNPRYIEQVHLLLSCIPAVSEQKCFALKGGSAINLFVHDMPRASVDIDLTYLPLFPRDEALAGIESALLCIKSKLEIDLNGVTVREKRIQGHLAKLIVITSSAEIKIEPNLILRGVLGKPVVRELCSAAQTAFKDYCRVPVVSDADLYAGKICAALDRQHPRDLFDIKILMEGSGITPDIRRAFVVYLAGHNRPIHELLNPNLNDIKDLFERQFAGMTHEPTTIAELIEVRHNLVANLVLSLDSAERQFLLSIKSGDPDWNILGFTNLKSMPALKWKLKNICKMDHQKRIEQLETLQRLLDQN